MTAVNRRQTVGKGISRTCRHVRADLAGRRAQLRSLSSDKQVCRVRERIAVADTAQCEGPATVFIPPDARRCGWFQNKMRRSRN